MGYLIFTIFFSMWELFCYVFYLYAQHNVLSYRLSYALPVGGGDKSMRSLPPPPGKYFFRYMEDIFAIFSSCGSLQLRLSLYAYHYTCWGYRLCCAPPPPGRKNVRKRPSHGIKIAKKFRVNSKIEKKRNNACALVKKRLR